MQDEELRDKEDFRSILGPILSNNRGRWLRFALAILKNKEDAEDALQEAVRRVLACNRPLRTREQARMYLGRAIGNAALELYNIRKRERLKHISIKEDLTLSANICSPYAILEEKEKAEQKKYLLRMLHKGLRILPWKQRQALSLTILETRGLSIRDAVSIYGIPYSTLRHRSKKGISLLRRYLKHELINRSQESGDRSQEREVRRQESE